MSNNIPNTTTNGFIQFSGGFKPLKQLITSPPRGHHHHHPHYCCRHYSVCSCGYCFDCGRYIRAYPRPYYPWYAHNPVWQQNICSHQH